MQATPEIIADGRFHAALVSIVIVVGLLFVPVGLAGWLLEQTNGARVETFGPVEVRAYTPNDPGNRWADGHVATGKRILRSDYSVAVSPDIEEWIGGISNAKVLHVPSYNRPGEFSAINDRSDLPERSVEVLMTAGNARRRALEWGVRRMVLYRQKTAAGWVYWLEERSE